MQLKQAAFAALTVLGIAASAAAPALPQHAPAGGQVNVKLLPISLHRIQRELQQSSSTESREGLRLRYQVDVYGRAPALELFTREDNLRDGPVPYGGPTHKEMLYMMTPQEFRAPVMDFTSFMRWLAEKANKK
jgi:hypothetical protein